MSAMPHSEPHLRVVRPCEGCEALQTQIDGQRDVILEQRRVIDDLDVDIRKKRRELSAAKGQYTKLLKKDPERNVQVDNLFEFYKRELKHPGAKLDDARVAAFVFALRKFSPSELAAAIKGCAVAGNPNPRTGGLHDKVGLILRDADHIEDFKSRYVKWYRDKHGRDPVIHPKVDDTPKRKRATS